MVFLINESRLKEKKSAVKTLMAKLKSSLKRGSSWSGWSSIGIVLPSPDGHGTGAEV